MAKNEHPAVAEVDARQKAMEEQNAEFYARLEASRPTPTQRENDLARVGALPVDSLEDDGSEWEADAQARLMQADLAGGPYATRALGGEGSEAPRRGRKAKGD